MTEGQTVAGSSTVMSAFGLEWREISARNPSNTSVRRLAEVVTKPVEAIPSEQGRSGWPHAEGKTRCQILSEAGLVEERLLRDGGYPFWTLRSLALRFRAFAAALEALIALSLRCFGVRASARAKPPCLASSDRTFLMSSSFMQQMIHPAWIVKAVPIDTVPAR